MIGAIENAILAALVDPRLGYEWAVRETFPDDLNAYLATIPNLRTPAAWASWVSSSQGEADDAGNWVSTCRFVLAVATQNLRNEQQSRHGDGAQPGSYQLFVDAARLLSGNWLEPLELVRPIAVLSAAPLARNEQMEKQNLSAIALVLECRAVVSPFAGEMGEFRTLHVDWDVPPIGNVTLPPSGALPAENPDAEDLIEVPQ